MPRLLAGDIIVGIDPTSRGFAFAVLEAPAYLVDWGSKTAPAKSRDLRRKVDALLSRYEPDMLVLEDLAAEGVRRRVRAREEIQAMERLAFTRGVRVERVSRLGVLDTFAPGKTKYEVAARLGEIFPVLTKQLPRRRKAWTPEEARLNVFDALGIAAAVVERAENPPPPEPRDLCAPHGEGSVTRPFQRGDGGATSGWKDLASQAHAA
jgi:hypothetical protein